MTFSAPKAFAESNQLAEKISHLALEKKADHVLSLDIHELTSMADFFIICSADTGVQVKAICDAIRRGTDHKPFRMEGYQQLNWVLMDYLNVVVHIFRTTERHYYNIEKLWADAPLTEYKDEFDSTINESLV